MYYPLKINLQKLAGYLLIFCLSLLAAACPAQARPSRVVLVNSPLRAEYEQASKTIVGALVKGDNSLAAEKITFDSKPEMEDNFWRKVLDRRPDLIVTVGTPATRSAISKVRNVPIIFTMVLDNISDLDSDSRSPDINGVTLAIPVRQQLEMMEQALPNIRRIGLLYSGNSSQIYQSARDIASQKGLRLVASEIISERDIPDALRRIISEVDIFWMPPDAVIYDQNILQFILKECFRNSVPIMALSRQIAMAGTPLALGVDYDDIAIQTAELAQKRISRGPFSKLIVEHPRKVILYINERVASRLNLNIPGSIVEQAEFVKSGSY